MITDIDSDRCTADAVPPSPRQCLVLDSTASIGGHCSLSTGARATAPGQVSSLAIRSTCNQLHKLMADNVVRFGWPADSRNVLISGAAKLRANR